MDCASSSLALRLREACHENNLQEVRRLLVEKDAVSVINDADEQGATALHFAAGWTVASDANKTWQALNNEEGENAGADAHDNAMDSILLAFSGSPDTAPLVKLLLEHGAQVDQPTREWSLTPLICASSVGHLSVVSALLSAGANVKAVGEVGGNSLHEASQYGHAEIVSMLLKAGADIEAKTHMDSTALISASSWGRAAVVSVLLTAGADTEVKDIDSFSAVSAAAYYGHAEVVSLLLAAGGNDKARDNHISTVLLSSAKNGYLDVVSSLLAGGADIEARDKDSRTALLKAAFDGNKELVSLLLAAGADIEARESRGDTALLNAAALGHAEVVSLLLDAGANIEAKNIDSWTALHDAASAGEAGAVTLLLDAGADVEAKNNDGNTALLQASSFCHAELVSVLLAAGAEVNAKGSDGSTALIYAAHFDGAAVVSLLLAAAADIEARDNNGWNALLDAASEGNAEVVSLLLDAGANVEARTNAGLTALQYAASKGNASVVPLLLAAGADIDATNSAGGNTALFQAVYNGYAEIVGDLLAAGADVNKRRDGGLTHLMLAISRSHPQIADAILTHGKNVGVGAVTSEGLTARDYAQKKGYGGIIRKLEIAERRNNPASTADIETVHETQPQLTSSPAASSALATLLSYLPAWKRPRTMAPTTAPPVLPPNIDGNEAAFHSSWLIPYGDLELGIELGRGSSARVYNAIWQETDVAVKVFDLPGGLAGTRDEFSASLLAKISAEADLLASIRHPNVIAFLGACHDPPSVVTEMCLRGSLFNILHQAKTDASSAAELTWARRLSLAVDAANGLLHLHQRSPSVMHRNLKSLNLLVDSNWKVKVSDLGLSKLVNEVDATTAITADNTANQSLNSRYMAPEVARGDHTTLSSDVYAFGVVLWELLTWELPWSHVPNSKEIIPCIVRGDALPIPTAAACPGPPPMHTSTYSEYIALMQQCTARSPAERPQFAAIVQKLKALLKQEGGTAALGAWEGSFNNGAASIPVCVVCLEQPATAGLVHQSAEMVHRCCCAKCAKLLRDRGDACPMCRRPINAVLQHFH